MIPFSIIVALDAQNGIGKNGRLPWHLPGDLKHFKDLTCRVQDPVKKNLVIMGRKTWDSIPEKFRPLSKRVNCVLTRNKDYILPAEVLPVQNLEAALQLTQHQKLKNRIESIFVIGGAEVFKSAVPLPNCHKLYVTHILETFGCDTFFPSIQADFKRVTQSPSYTENGVKYYFAEYTRAK